MSEQTQDVAQQPQKQTVTFEIVKASFNKELTALQFQEALNSFNAWSVTPENVTATQEKIKRVRGFMRKLEEIKKNGKQEAMEICKYWDRAYNEIYETLETSLRAKEKDLQIIVDKIAEENRKKEAERQRIEGIKKAIDTFFLDTSKAIAEATTTEQLVVLQKLIGSHKANKTRYQEFIPELSQRAEELTPLINKQKEHINELAEIEKQKAEALAKDDDRALEQLQERQELVQHSITESKIVVQETAIHQALNMDNAPVVPQQQQVKYRRKSWKFEVTDINLLFKKMPHLVTLVANDEKIKELIESKKGAGELKDTEEVLLPGLRIYLEKLA